MTLNRRAPTEPLSVVELLAGQVRARREQIQLGFGDGATERAQRAHGEMSRWYPGQGPGDEWYLSRIKDLSPDQIIRVASAFEAAVDVQRSLEGIVPGSEIGDLTGEMHVKDMDLSALPPDFVALAYLKGEGIDLGPNTGSVYGAWLQAKNP